jgi:hypothetical protein
MSLAAFGGMWRRIPRSVANLYEIVLHSKHLQETQVE